jgi:NAD-dependent deacetylase
MNGNENNIGELISLIEESSYITALTGAGISTLSGIPDFRGEHNPIWEKFPQNLVFDITYFASHPQMFFDFLREILSKEYEPNIAHRVLKHLEDEGKLKAVITQNIDGLHSKTGNKKIYELHGSIYESTCVNCGKGYDYEAFLKKVLVDKVPSCDDCSGVVKPNVVFYGEQLPQEAMETAIYNASHSDLMLVIGTSLQVFPAAYMPHYTLKHGGKVVLINRGETTIDDQATLKFDDIEQVFNRLGEYYELK